MKKRNSKQKNFITSTLILLACSFTLSLACSSSSGGDSPAAEVLPPAPTGLYLRTEGEDNRRVYSGGDSTIENGDGTETRNFDTIDLALLEEGADGSGTAISLGTLAHDDYVPGLVADADDGAGDGDDISIAYSYSLAEDAGDDYSNNLFDISENVLSFTGSDSGDYATSPTLDVQIDTRYAVTVTLASDFVGRINADASDDVTDADTRKFAFDGGAMSNIKEVQTIAAENTLNLGGIVLTAVAGTATDDGFSIFIARRVATGDQVGVRVDGTMITVEYGTNSTFAQLKNALETLTGTGGTLEGVFNISTDNTYKSADNIIDGRAASNIDKAFREFLGGNASRKARVTLGDATIEASDVGGGFNRILNFNGQYDSTRAANYIDVTVGTQGGNFRITVNYGLGATLEQLMTELGTLWTADTSPAIGSIAFYLSEPPSDGFTANTLLADIFGTYDGIITAGSVVRAQRTVDVAGGEIYLADAEAGSGKIISFEAVTTLRVYEDSFVIVTDADGDDIGEVSAVAKTSLPDIDYYVLGEVEVVPVTGAKASLTKTAVVGSDTASVTFTADEAGLEGNDLSITFIFSGKSAAGDNDVTFAYASNNLTITYDFGATLTKIKTEFDAVTDTDIISKFDLAINSGGTITATNVFGNVQLAADGTGGTAEALTGGTGGTTMGTTTANTTGTATTDPAWITFGDEIIDTVDYTIKLKAPE